MYREVLQSIEGVEVYPIVSLLIFFTFFVGVIVWALGMDRGRVNELARLPLDGDVSQAEEDEGHE